MPGQSYAVNKWQKWKVLLFGATSAISALCLYPRIIFIVSRWKISKNNQNLIKLPDPKNEMCRMHQESFSGADPPVSNLPGHQVHVQHPNRESLDDGCLLLSLAACTCVCVLTRYLREHIFIIFVFI